MSLQNQAKNQMALLNNIRLDWSWNDLNNGMAWTMKILLVIVGTESDQHVNIYSFAVRYDRRWPNAQWHRIYTGSGNVPYVQLGSVGDFIPEPRRSKSVVGVQMRRGKKGGYKRFGWLRPEGSRSELDGPTVVRCWCRSSESELEETWSLLVGGSVSPFIDEGDSFL